MEHFSDHCATCHSNDGSGDTLFGKGLYPKPPHTSAIYLSKTAAGLAAEAGEWADGTTDAGPFVACTHENLSIAIRWLIVQNRITQANESSRGTPPYPE
jgi:mono/diheme cytochrome c family protein